MIRWATEADRWPLINFMRAAKFGCGWYDYKDMDGQYLIDESGGSIRGYLRLALSRPESHILQLVVAPEFQNKGTVARGLVQAAVDAAREFGSQGLEGFTHFDQVGLISQWKRAGAVVQPGARVRWVIGEHALLRMQKDTAAASPSTNTSPAT